MLLNETRCYTLLLNEGSAAYRRRAEEKQRKDNEKLAVTDEGASESAAYLSIMLQFFDAGIRQDVRAGGDEELRECDTQLGIDAAATTTTAAAAAAAAAAGDCRNSVGCCLNAGSRTMKLWWW